MKFLNPQEKAGLYSFSKILVKNENVCSQYNNEMKSLLNESEDVMNSLYIITNLMFVLAPLSFAGFLGNIGEKKNHLVTNIIIYFIFLYF